MHYSLFGMDQSIYAHLAAQQPVQSFTGAYSAEYLYFIVRREGDLGGALAAARRLLGLLFERFELPAGSLLLYYSGGYGFHIGLNQHLFGDFEPGPQLPCQLAALSRRVLAASFRLDVETLELLESGIQSQRPGEHFADVVPGVCQPGQLLRAPNSRNASTGRYKVPLHAQELITITLAQLLHLAAHPRPNFTLRPASLATPNPALASLWQRTLGHEPTEAPLPAPVEEPRLFMPATSQAAAPALLRQARYLVQHSQLTTEHILDLLTVLNRAGRRPLAAEEVHILFNEALAQRPTAPRVTPGSVMPYQGLPWSGPGPPRRPQLCASLRTRARLLLA